MKKTLLTFLTFIFLAISVHAEEESDNSYFGIQMGQDPVFGFYPVAYGGWEIGESLYFTYYGVFWTQDLLGGGDGTNLYTEFGVGVSYTTGNLTINPSLGILGGNFHSGGDRAVIGDGIVPALYLIYALPSGSVALSAIYWKGLREEVHNGTFYDLFEYIVKPEFTISKHFDIGLYYDHLITNTRIGDKSDNESSYLWLGPSIKIKSSKGASLWFSTGVDLVDYTLDVDEEKIKDYYKLLLTIDL